MTPDDCRELRTRLGVTPSELARRAGLVERTVLRFEAGLARPRPVTLVALWKSPSAAVTMWRVAPRAVANAQARSKARSQRLLAAIDTRPG